jgi:hypothetical protein
MWNGVVLMDFTLHSMFPRTPVWRKCIREGCFWPWLCSELNVSVHRDGGRPRRGILEILQTDAIIAEISIP